MALTVAGWAEWCGLEPGGNTLRVRGRRLLQDERFYYAAQGLARRVASCITGWVISSVVLKGAFKGLYDGACGGFWVEVGCLWRQSPSSCDDGGELIHGHRSHDESDLGAS